MNTTTPTTAEKVHALRWAYAGDAANNVFCQLTFSGAVFILFLNEVGLEKTQIGFLLSLFPFCGLLAPFIASSVARWGLKRTYLTFWGTRKCIMAFAVLIPWVLHQFGPAAAFGYVTALLAAFAVCRAIAETAYVSWLHEFVPQSIRGKFTATTTIISTLCGAATTLVASRVIGASSELERFTWLITAGLFFGFLSVWCASFLPGGSPIPAAAGDPASARGLRVPRDRNFLLYLAGLGLITLSSGILSFVPLYAKNQIGLSSGDVILLQVWAMLGGLFSSYLWGWASDRYGSRPVLLFGLALMPLIPLAWLFVPRHDAWSATAAMTLAVFSGVAGSAWSVACSRLLYVSVVPSEKRTEYMPFYYAWMGLTGGIGPLLAGYALDRSGPVAGRLAFLTLDSYTPLFASSLFLLLAGLFLLRSVRGDGRISPGAFAGLFLQGNPFMAVESLIRFSFATDEEQRVEVTELMGQARSPLNVDELLEALSDPSFNVRYEAIIAIAHTRPDDRLISALVDVLRGQEPDLSLAAAWALGRIGDPRAIEPLRETLTSGYPLLRARSARALGTLGDAASAHSLIERLRTEADDGLRIAYVAALGSLGAREAVPDILAFLARAGDPKLRMEIALAVARTVGPEEAFVRLWRRARSDRGTSLSQVLSSFAQEREAASGRPNDDLAQLAGECAQAFARENTERGQAALLALLLHPQVRQIGEPRHAVLEECRQRLSESGRDGLPYLLLAIHTLVNGGDHAPAASPRRNGEADASNRKN
ncbi:MAG: MFS transporter [Planctomycetes bacterium]|nr:MFS transporter [Planctomycetota bacterium]